MIVFLRVAVVILLFGFVVSPATAQEKLRFYLGASSKTLGYSPLWVAAKKGFFEQQGLDVQLLLLRGTPMTVQALAGASLNVGSGSPEAFIEASERGLDLVIIGGVINGLTRRSHPCQVMADVMTFEEHRGPIAGQIVSWCGDGNNVARSWIEAAVRFGFTLRLATPEQLRPQASPEAQALAVCAGAAGATALRTRPNRRRGQADEPLFDSQGRAGEVQRAGSSYVAALARARSGRRRASGGRCAPRSTSPAPTASSS